MSPITLPLQYKGTQMGTVLLSNVDSALSEFPWRVRGHKPDLCPYTRLTRDYCITLAQAVKIHTDYGNEALLAIRHDPETARWMVANRTRIHFRNRNRLDCTRLNLSGGIELPQKQSLYSPQPVPGPQDPTKPSEPKPEMEWPVNEEGEHVAPSPEDDVPLPSFATKPPPPSEDLDEENLEKSS